MADTSEVLASTPSRVLVVDDNRMNRMKLARAVEELGYESQVAEDGAEALELLRGEGIDAVLLDLIMPGIDGYEVLERMAGDPTLRDVPVVVITSVEDTASIVRCLELGAEDHLPKDVHPLVLRARLRAALSRNERRALERRLVDQETSLRQSQKLAAVGRLAAGFAHELNNPASAVRRAAGHLGAAAARLAAATSDLSAVRLDAPQLQWLEARRSAAVAAVGGPSLSGLARADREDEIAAALGSFGGAAGADLSVLVDAGVTAEDVHAAIELFGEHSAAALVALAAQAELARIAHEISSGAGRISELVDRMKSYAFMDQAPEQAVDVHVGLDDVLTVLGSAIGAGVDVVREYAEDLPPVEGRGGELNDVWANLIDNALHAMAGSGTLRLRTRRTVDGVAVEVEDDGPGIPEELRGRVFDPFVTTKAPGQGTGLGLNAVHTIVERHGGRVGVDSRPGRTTFTVELPVNGSR